MSARGIKTLAALAVIASFLAGYALHGWLA
jgi:hypothetical protein